MTGMLAGYSTTSPELESVGGVSVGDPIGRAQRRLGDELVLDPAGSGAYMLSEGEPGSYPALRFALAYGGRRITQISGGGVPPAGG